MDFGVRTFGAFVYQSRLGFQVESNKGLGRVGHHKGELGDGGWVKDGRRRGGGDIGRQRGKLVTEIASFRV